MSDTLQTSAGRGRLQTSGIGERSWSALVLDDLLDGKESGRFCSALCSADFQLEIKNELLAVCPGDTKAHGIRLLLWSHAVVAMSDVAFDH